MRPHILLTSDLTEESLRAFRPTAEYAKALDGRITLLHVIHTPSLPASPGMHTMPIADLDTPEIRERARAALELQRAAIEPDIPVEIDIIASPSLADAIVERAKTKEADLIAISTHGRSGVRRLVLGSVAEGVVRRAHVPVHCYPPVLED